MLGWLASRRRLVAGERDASLVRRPVFAALAACFVFAIVGVATLDHHGLATDENARRQMAVRAVDYVLGKNTDMMDHFDRFQGVAFELPLFLAESALGLEDPRSIHLVRHLLSHVFFLVGGFFCGLLAYRLTGNRAVAALALLMFLLHPRLYAHSFFNTKDVPFAAMFMIALFCAWRAFDKGAWRSFALAGAVAGALASMRIAGLGLILAVLVLQACDVVSAREAQERKRNLLTCGVFVLAGATSLYATWPYLWGDPMARLAEVLAVATDHPMALGEMFRGERTISSDVPWSYVPVWFAATTPPVALAFGLLGTIVVLAKGATRPREALRNGRLRFLLLTAACFLAPVVVALVFQPTVFNGWRHFYFIYAPFVLLAAAGVHWLASALRPAVAKGAAYCVAALGVLWTIVAMVGLHPRQHLYFNALVDKDGPERLAEQYELDYWNMSYRDALKFLLARHPDQRIHVEMGNATGLAHGQILRPEERERLVFGEGADFVASVYRDRGRSDWRPVFGHVVHSLKVYNSTIMEVAMVALPDDADETEPYRKAYESVLEGTPAVEAVYDVYVEPDGLAYVKESCTRADTRGHVILHAAPADVRDLPSGRQLRGYVGRQYAFGRYGVRFGQTCLIKVPVMDFPLKTVRTGQRSIVSEALSNWTWEAIVDFRPSQDALPSAGAPADVPGGDGREPAAQP